MPLQIFSPRVNLSSNSQHCLSQSRAFNFSEIYPISYLFINYGFGVLSKKSSPNPRWLRCFPLSYSRSVTLFHFTFRSIIPFEFAFVKILRNFYSSLLICIIFILLYNTVLVLPHINMNLPRVYTCSQSWALLPPPSPYHLSGSSQCTSPMHPVFCIEPGLVIHFLYDIFQA